MAERRPPGFNVDLGFYDSDEVLSIPRKIRAAAVGVWTLCGSFSANKMTDGYVSAEALRDRGCTPAIRAALKATTKADGTPSPLWGDAHDGGIQFSGWPKWQRTAAEIKAYREAEAERKREARAKRKNGHVDATRSPREAHVDATWTPGDDQAEPTLPSRNDNGHGPTSGYGDLSARTSDGHPPESRDPKTETKTETEINNSGYVPDEATDPNAQGISATPAAQLVREIIPNGHPAATLTSLRLQSSELLNNGHDRGDVADALRLWCSKPGVGIGRTIVASLVSEVIKGRTGANGKPHKVRAFLDLAAEVRADEQAQLESANRKAIE